MKMPAIRWMILLAGLLAGLGLLRAPGLAEETPPAGLNPAARDLLAAEQSYFDDRLHHRWEAIYARQHPRYQQQVTLPLFVNTNGLATYDPAKTSANPPPRPGPLDLGQPSSEKIEPAVDALGFPSERKYQFYPNPWVRIDQVKYLKVWISPDGRYGKVDLLLNVTERLPPALFRVDIVLPQKRRQTDYWEFIDGTWHVALMVHQPSLSGSRMDGIVMPNELDRLEQIDWVGFDPESLKTSQSEKP